MPTLLLGTVGDRAANRVRVVFRGFGESADRSYGRSVGRERRCLTLRRCGRRLATGATTRPAAGTATTAIKVQIHHTKSG